MRPECGTTKPTSGILHKLNRSASVRPAKRGSALKLKNISYIHTEGYSAGEMLVRVDHGQAVTWGEIQRESP